MTRGFLLSGGHFVTLNVPGALETSAQGINSSGTNIVGVFYVPRGNGQQLARGFLLKKGVFTTIVVPNTDQTYAIGVNNSGEIVGEFVRTPSSLTESFLYRRGVFSAVSPPNSRITQALPSGRLEAEPSAETVSLCRGPNWRGTLSLRPPISPHPASRPRVSPE